jgi:hypothetical protein
MLAPPILIGGSTGTAKRSGLRNSHRQKQQRPARCAFKAAT